jgi:hypothetical protein
VPETAKTRRESKFRFSSPGRNLSAALASVPDIVSEMDGFVRPEVVEGHPRWATTGSARIWREVLRRRLATQRLTGAELPTATDVVRLLGCVQSQEY